MSVNETSATIPVAVTGQTGRIHRSRRISQLATLVLLVVIPLSGLFHISVADGAIIILDRQIWFSDFFIVFGFWIMAASLLVMSYSLAGAVFCGWVCPQGSVSEWANALTRKWLGRNADMMDLSGEAMQVAVRRDSWRNRMILFACFVLAAMFYAIIPLLYFFPPEQLWQVVTLRATHAGSVLWIYFVFVVILFLDIAVIRHMMCRYMCIYRMWQHSFKTKDTLHVAYDKSRSDHCATCHYCEDSCYLDIDPRNTVVFDSCINCGECIEACDALHAGSRKWTGSGLLSFAFGDETGERGRGNVGSFFSRVRAAFPVALLGGVMFAYGLSSYEPYHLSAFRSETRADGLLLDYQINVANKLYHPVNFDVQVEGLPEGSWQLAHDTMHFSSAGRQNVILYISKNLPHGLYNFVVRVQSDHGWSSVYKVRHFAPGVKG